MPVGLVQKNEPFTDLKASPRAAEKDEPKSAARAAGLAPATLALPTLILSLAVITTAAVVQYSMRHGRLAIPPAYDDVGYLADAAARVDAFWRSGPMGLASSFRRFPPHSPYSSLVGMTAFLLFGLHDWAPYAMNSIIVASYLLFANYLLRPLILWQKAICFVLLLCIPLVGESVYEFRPDHMSALLTVAACMFLLERPVLYASRRRLVLMGLLFAFAMFTKPSTFPAILILLLACLVLGVVADSRGDGLAFRPSSFARAWGILLAGTAILIVPYFAFDLHSIVAYIYDNFFGMHSAQWKFKGGFPAILKYDLTGAGGKAMLGNDAVVLMVILALAGVYCLLHRDRRQIYRMLVLALLLFATYMMGVMNHMKSIFTGLTFQTCVVFLAIRAIAFLFSNPASRRLATPIVVVAALVTILRFAWPSPWGDYNDVMATSRREMAAGIFDALAGHEVHGHNRVLIQGVGDINHSILSYMAVKQQRDLVFTSLPDSDEIAPAVAEWDHYDFIVASQQNTRVTADFLLRYRTLDELLERLKQRPDFREVGFFPFALSGKGYYVFQKVNP